METTKKFYPGNLSKPTETVYPKNYELNKMVDEVEALQKDYQDHLTKTLDEVSKGLKTVGQQVEDINWMLDRKKLLEDCKANDKEAPSDEEGRPTNSFVESISTTALETQRKYLEDSLTLNLLEEKLKTKGSAVAYSPKDVEGFLRRADREIVNVQASAEMDVFKQTLPIGYASVRDVYTFITNLSLKDPKLQVLNRKFMILFCKVIMSDYKHNRLYYNNIIRNFSKVAIYYKTKREDGIAEAKELITSIDRIYRGLFAHSK